jgi:hypothetical protein
MDRDRLREQMEASRAGEVDLGLSEVEALELRAMLADDPQLAAELDRMHAWDAAVETAFAEPVKIPDGLAQRLKVAAAAELEQLKPTPNSAAPVSIALLPHRHWLRLALTTAALLLVGVGLWSAWPHPQHIAEAKLIEAMQQLPEEPEVAWQASLDELPAGVVPVDIRRNRVQRWGLLATDFDREAVVLDLVKPGMPAARVIAVHAPGAVTDLPLSPSYQPVASTGGVSLGAWQSEPYVYVLMVKGNAARYRLFLKDPAQLTAR